MVYSVLTKHFFFRFQVLLALIYCKSVMLCDVTVIGQHAECSGINGFSANAYKCLINIVIIIKYVAKLSVW